MAHDADRPCRAARARSPGSARPARPCRRTSRGSCAAFFRDDRLATIPANAAKRRIVLVYLRDRCFPEDRAYPEKEVNQRLALFHPDVAALRRYMVDERPDDPRERRVSPAA